MIEYIKHFSLFFSIFSFFSGVIVLTINGIICQTSRKLIYRKLKIYHWIFTLYTLTIFIFYYDKIFIYGNAALVVSYIGNLLLAVLNRSYALLILELNQQNKGYSYYFFEAANILYALVWFYILFFEVKAPTNMKMVSSPLSRTAILITELFQLVSMLVFLLSQLRQTSGGRLFYYFCVIFLLENTWEILYDTGIAFQPFQFTHHLEPFSMITVIYFVTNIILICCFYRKELFPKNTSTSKDESSLEEKIASYPFTKREQELIRLLIKGKSNQEIAEELFISQNTVKHHISNIYKKANVKNRIQIIQLFTREGE